MNTASLAREIGMLRSFAISIVGRDPEGDYRPEFAQEALRAANLAPTERFESAKQFLAELQNPRNA